MLISSRRLQWGFIFGLAIASGLLLRPVRSWMEQHMLARMIDPNLSIGELRVHATHSLIEIRQLRWKSADGGRAFGLSAERAWVTVDPEPLLDSRKILPRVVFQDARLFLAELPVEPLEASHAWHQRLVERVAQLDWQEIRRHCSSLPATDDLAETWSDRIENWVRRSSEIAQEAESLELQSTSANNPLRSHDEVQSKLVWLDELSTEQRILSDQFLGITKLIESESQRMRGKLIDESRALMDVVDAECNDSELVQNIAQEALQNLALKSWGELNRYAEVSDRLARAACARAKPQGAYDLRSHSAPVLELRAIRADGLFADAGSQMPFQLTGHYCQTQLADYSTAIRLLWQLEFTPEPATVKIVASNRRLQPLVNDIQVSVGTPVDPTRGAAPHLTNRNQMVIAADGESIEGWMTLTTEDLDEAFGVNDVEAISMILTGSWHQPKFEIGESVPAWLLHSIQQKIESEFSSAYVVAQRELHQHFDRQLTKLQSVLQYATQNATTTTDRHREQIVLARNKLEEHLDEIAGIEFAPRPAPTAEVLTR